jgi:hypothetical protein
MAIIGTTIMDTKLWLLMQANPHLVNHKGGAEIAVDEQTKTMYAWGVFVALHGLDSIMNAANKY